MAPHTYTKKNVLHIFCFFIIFSPIRSHHFTLKKSKFIYPHREPCRQSVSVLPKYDFIFYSHSFRVSAIKLRNLLPHLISNPSLYSFKNQLKLYYLSCSQNKKVLSFLLLWFRHIRTSIVINIKLLFMQVCLFLYFI